MYVKYPQDNTSKEVYLPKFTAISIDSINISLRDIDITQVRNRYLFNDLIIFVDNKSYKKSTCSFPPQIMT